MKKIEKLSFLTISFYAKVYNFLNFLTSCKAYVKKREQSSVLSLYFYERLNPLLNCKTFYEESRVVHPSFSRNAFSGFHCCENISKSQNVNKVLYFFTTYKVLNHGKILYHGKKLYFAKK